MYWVRLTRWVRVTSIFAPSGTSTSTEVDGIYGVGPLGLREEGGWAPNFEFVKIHAFGDPSGETSANLVVSNSAECASVRKVREVCTFGHSNTEHREAR